jgi:hypothetical protein
MEAGVLEKEAGMTEWTDGRLNELSKRMDEGFDRVDRKMDEGFGRVDADIRELTGRFDALQQTLVRISLTMSVAMFSVFAALIVDHF